MKVLVQPVKPMALLLPYSETLHPFRPSVVTSGEYLMTFVGRGEIEILASDLSDETCDSDFEKVWNECKDAKTGIVDRDLAVQSFAASLKTTVPASKEEIERLEAERLEAERKAAEQQQGNKRR